MISKDSALWSSATYRNSSFAYQ